jgi:hypothetical protein
MAKFGYNIPFLWILAGTGLLAIGFFLRMLFLSKNLEQEARSDWAYRVSENMQDLRLTEDAFVRAYIKINAPRGWKFLSMALATVTVISVPAFALIQMLLYKVWRDNLNEVSQMPQFRGRVAVLSDPVLVWQFSIFLAVIVFLVLVVALFVRQYYRGSPGLMRDELIFERAGFMPETKLTVGPNLAHLDAGADGYSREIYKDIFEAALGLARRVEKNWRGSGHDCDIYSDGSEMQVCVHTKINADGYSAATHPFFFAGDFARHDDKPVLYTIITLVPDAHIAFEKIRATGIVMTDISATKTSRKCSFASGSMAVFIYDARG